MKTHEIEYLVAERAWVARLARRMLRDSDAAEDVAQDTLVAALESPPPVDRPARGWLGRVATNVVRGRHRSTTRRTKREHTVAAHADAEAEDTFASLLQQQAAAHLAAALAELAEPFHTAIRLRFFDDLSVAEVAARQGVPIGTAGWRISEGVKRLRAALEARAGGDARPYLMALCPAIPMPSSVPFEAAAPASFRGGEKNMSKWIGIGVAATVIVGAGTVATVVASNAADAADHNVTSVESTSHAQTVAAHGRQAPATATHAAGTTPTGPTSATTGGAGSASAAADSTGVIMLIKRSGPGAAGELPEALYGDVNDYSRMLFECFDAQREGPDREKRATLRISMIQEEDRALIESSEASSVKDPDLGECLSAIGLAIRLDEPIGPIGTRYEVDLQLQREMPAGVLSNEAALACLDDLKRRNPTAKLHGRIDDPELTKCMTASFPGAALTRSLTAEARTGLERCTAELRARRPDTASGTNPIDDAPFRRCIEDVMGGSIDDGPIMFLDGAASPGELEALGDDGQITVHVPAL